ncbi:MAG: hypothetical protein QG574_759 [Cyanobacteriota bacterium erpe_2018_sw_21hr_WHONDRS-SW48-000092_B_bin.40]|jgi:hypothetical protein|nr:hypothetical protein [Cyanobacteriota bacterium erpe_2018_sw_21hr_WHONDRS-SW48-000092_B_bin.40]
MIDPAVFVSPIRLALWVIKLLRKARANALTHLNTRIKRRRKFNGDLQLVALLVTSLALIPMVVWFSGSILSRGEAAHFNESKIAPMVVAPSLRATLKSIAFSRWKKRQLSKGARYRSSLVEQESEFEYLGVATESRGIAQELERELYFESISFYSPEDSQLNVFWSEEDYTCDWKSKQGRSIVYGLECGFYLLAGLACLFYHLRISIKTTENRLKLYFQIGRPRNAAKHRVFKTRSLCMNRLRWSEWRVNTRWYC